MQVDGIELYLGKDIIMGEEVPFYLIWERDDIKEIKINIDGFKEISEFYNLKPSALKNDHTFEVSDIQYGNYLGGLLKTESKDVPIIKGNFIVTIKLSNDKSFIIQEKRDIYTSILSNLVIPNTIKLPLIKPVLELDFKGETTIFIDILSIGKDGVIIDLPSEIKTAIEKFYVIVMNGLEKLREKYPIHDEFITLLIKFYDYQLNMGVPEIEDLQKMEELIPKVTEDEDFIDSFEIIIFKAMINNQSLQDTLLTPLKKYFESNAAEKSFLFSPLSVINIPKGTNLFKGIIRYKDIFGVVSREKEFQTIIESNEDKQIPIKNFINIRRI